MEFLFAVGTLFFIFLFILAFVFNKKVEINNLDKIIDAKGECDRLSDIIMGVFLSGNETTIKSSLNFNASIFSSSRLVSIDDDFVTCTIPIDQTFDRTLEKGDIIVVNKNNFVDVQNV